MAHCMVSCTSLGEVVGAADVGHADVVLVHPLDVPDEIAPEELHQEVDLRLGATEVILEREGVEGEPGEVDARGGFDHELDGFRTLLMAEEALERAVARPTAIAVHDDGDVLGNFIWVELPVDGHLLGGRASLTRLELGVRKKTSQTSTPAHAEGVSDRNESSSCATKDTRLWGWLHEAGEVRGGARRSAASS